MAEVKNKMKVILLNNGGYEGLSKVEFPVEVEAYRDPSGYLAAASKSELVRVGAEADDFDSRYVYMFILGVGFRLVEEEL